MKLLGKYGLLIFVTLSQHSKLIFFHKIDSTAKISQNPNYIYIYIHKYVYINIYDFVMLLLL